MIAFIVGDSVYLYYSGFDPAWARYSVMTTTLAETFQYAIANGLKTVNLSLTPEQSKLRWRPRLIEFRSALVYRENRPSGLAYRPTTPPAPPRRGPVPARLLKGLLGARRSWN